MHKSCLEDYKVIYLYFYRQTFEVRTADSEHFLRALENFQPRNANCLESIAVFTGRNMLEN
jgi:hypothetical protein